MPAHDGLLMTDVVAALRRRAADERGFSLIEVLMVFLVLTVILGAILGVLDATHKAAPRDQERGDVIRETQTGMERMTRELRHAYKVTSAGQWSITAQTYSSGTSTTVTYDCSVTDPTRPEYRMCERTAASGSTGPVVRRVLLIAPPGGGSPPPVFEYGTNDAGRIDRVDITLVTSATGDLKEGYTHNVTLRDGFYLRNVDSCGNQEATECP